MAMNLQRSATLKLRTFEEYYGNIGKGRKRASLMHDPARASSYCYLRGVADAPCRRVPSCRRGRTIES